MLRIKRWLFDILESPGSESTISRVFNISMLTLIFLNVLAVIFETEEAVFTEYQGFFRGFEIFSVVVFTIEHLLRIWVCTEHEQYKEPIRGRIRFALRPSMAIDLLAFLPFYIPVGGMDLRFIRAFRLFRLFRLFKMGRYSQSLAKLLTVVKAKKEELIITLFSGIVLLIVASSIMYFVEREAQPDLFGSIPKAMWWGAVTLTTVGYGDVYPVTTLGRFLSAFISVLGIGLFALPAGIIASGFASELEKNKAEKIVCPHCGRDINAVDSGEE